VARGTVQLTTLDSRRWWYTGVPTSRYLLGRVGVPRLVGQMYRLVGWLVGCK
jgi:hypothetical protein